MNYIQQMRLLALGVVVVAGLAGCDDGGGGDGSRLSVGPREVTAECTPRVEFCDITSSDCQAHLFEATACARLQADDSLPTIRTIDTDALRVEAMQMVQDVGGLEPTPWDVALTLLELIPADQTSGEATVEDLVAGVAAFYAPDTREVTIIEGSSGDDDRTASSILSHEFVHVLQDRAQGLQAVSEQWTVDTDTSVAVSHLIEGEAEVVSTIVTVYGDGAQEADIDWERYFDDMLGAVLEVVEEAPSPFITALGTLPYPQGGRVLSGIRQARGQEALEAIYHDGPGISVDWLAGATPRPLDEVIPRCVPPPPGTGRGVIGLDRFGAVALVGLLVGQGLTGAEALELAGDLRADTIAVFVNASGEDEVTVDWRLEFESSAGAADVGAAITSDAIGVALDDDVVRLWAGEADSPLLALEARESCSDLATLSQSALPIRRPLAAPMGPHGGLRVGQLPLHRQMTRRRR